MLQHSLQLSQVTTLGIESGNHLLDPGRAGGLLAFLEPRHLLLRLVLGFTIVLALALAGVSIYVGYAAEQEVARFEESQAELKSKEEFSQCSTGSRCHIRSGCV